MIRRLFIPLHLTAALLLFCTAGISAAEETGYASWYGGKFHGRLTANGETFDTNKLTAAHKTLPFGTVVEVTNLSNGESVQVRINDRGPFVEGRIIDLSRAAAREIDMLGSGVARVSLTVLRRPDGSRPDGSRPDGSRPDGSRPERRRPEGGGTAGSPETGSAAVDTAANTAAEAQLPSAEQLPVPRLKSAGPEDGAPGGAVKPVTPSSYSLQIASFSMQENARELRRRLLAHGFNPSFEQSGSGHIRVVLNGIEPQRLAQVERQLAELGYASVLVREKYGSE
jgi:rare lipoprotein A